MPAAQSTRPCVWGSEVVVAPASDDVEVTASCRLQRMGHMEGPRPASDASRPAHGTGKVTGWSVPRSGEKTP
eukprot:6417852-Pyramimonas_sp.AAC.1